MSDYWVEMSPEVPGKIRQVACGVIEKEENNWKIQCVVFQSYICMG